MKVTVEYVFTHPKGMRRIRAPDILPLPLGIKAVFHHQTGHFLNTHPFPVYVAKLPAYPWAAISKAVPGNYFSDETYQLGIRCLAPL